MFSRTSALGLNLNIDRKLLSASKSISACWQPGLYILRHLTLCFVCFYYHAAAAAVDHTTAISRAIIVHHDLMDSHDTGLFDHMRVGGYAIMTPPALMAIHGSSAVEESTASAATMPKSIDAFERSNRRVHGLNSKFDKAIFKPAAKAYRLVLPKFLRRGFANFFRNITEAPGVVNKLAQGKPRAVAKGALRLLINSTLGIGGLIDLASRMKLEYEYEDFGQTLAVWGVGRGSYIVLPFFGPSTIRGGVGRVVETIISPFSVFPGFWSFNLIEQISVRSLELIGQRATLLSLEFIVTGDEYEFYRNSYLQRRDYLIHDGVLADDAFLDDDF